MKSFGRAISMLLTLKCREAAELLSRSMDGELSGAERWALRLHMGVCAACRRYRRQISSLREMLQDAQTRAEDGSLPGPPLPQQLREKLRALTDDEPR